MGRVEDSTRSSRQRLARRRGGVGPDLLDAVTVLCPASGWLVKLSCTDGAGRAQCPACDASVDVTPMPVCQTAVWRIDAHLGKRRLRIPATEVMAAYRQARSRARRRTTTGLRRQEARARRRATTKGMGEADQARLAAVRDELSGRGIGPMSGHAGRM